MRYFLLVIISSIALSGDAIESNFLVRELYDVGNIFFEKPHLFNGENSLNDSLKVIDTNHDKSKYSNKQTLGFQLNEVGEKGDVEFIPIVTYRKDIKSDLFLELGTGLLSEGEYTKFVINFDFFKTFLKVDNLKFTFGPGANLLFKSSDEETKTSSRIGLGFGLEKVSESELSNGHLFYFGRLYYPSYFTNTRNSSIGGSVGIMLQF